MIRRVFAGCLALSLLLSVTLANFQFTPEIRVSGLAHAAGVPAIQPFAEIKFLPWEIINSLAWSPAGGYLAISAGNQLSVYEAEGRALLGRLEVGALAPALAFSPAGDQLAAGNRAGVLQVWNITQLIEQFSRSTSQVAPSWQVTAHKKGVNDLVFSPDGSWLASSGNDGMARVWKTLSGERVSALIGGAFAVAGLALSPDGTILAVANGEMIRLRDVASGRITGSLRSETSLFGLAYHPSGKWLAAGGSENLVQLWDPQLAFRSGSTDYPDPIQLKGHSGRSGSSAALVWRELFSPDGRWLISAGGDKTVRVWDWESASLVATLRGHNGAVTSLAVSPDGKTLVSGSLDGRVKYWDLSGLQ